MNTGCARAARLVGIGTISCSCVALRRAVPVSLDHFGRGVHRELALVAVRARLRPLGGGLLAGKGSDDAMIAANDEGQRRDDVVEIDQLLAGLW
jgi:hypothetical protein